jgi:hypothetical protein
MASKPAVNSLVMPTTNMNTGTDSIAASRASPPPVTRWTARITRFPVMWAVNTPSPRKLMTSTQPAITLSTEGISFVTIE